MALIDLPSDALVKLGSYLLCTELMLLSIAVSPNITLKINLNYALNLTRTAHIALISERRVEEQIIWLLKKCLQVNDVFLHDIQNNADNLTDLQFKLLGDFPALRRIESSNNGTGNGCRITDKGFSFPSTVAFPQLLDLSVNFFSEITDHSLLQLAGKCKLLRRLSLSMARKITDAGLIAILDSCNHLEDLDISNCGHITDLGVQKVASNCLKMRRLNFSGLGSITDSSIIRIAESCHELRFLDVHECCEITENSIIKIFEKCIFFEWVDVSFCGYITGLTYF